MLAAVKTALLTVGKKVLLAVITEAVLKKVIISLLKEGAKKTSWELDDEIVREVEKALS